MQVKIKKLRPDAVIPSYAIEGDGAMDLTAIDYEFIEGRHMYKTGLSVEIPEGYVGLIFPRSSICNYDLRLTNSVGIIDQNFRGEIKFFFENDGIQGKDTRIEKQYFWSWENNSAELQNVEVIYPKIYNVGDRIGQLLILPYPKYELIEVDELSQTERGEGGFGSTGK